ncbi:acetyl-CoA C-acyltransferase [Ichthyobacterium seriolicida]|uniref:acetyl-CoA C-acetyltransferase n=1 Tax=Ichthyobacterium seriolicida TaxID=242600 RepID=A0A1J1EA25_9FLAO|nr:acetyl-CoA C-acyltransferase [Ichthyobacterium seriolicida]BAV94779.1 acetyl-CoA acetyltransferase [Ichthyobacterium seriolicida]
MKKVVIASAVRTPIGSFMGSLSGLSAPKLGSIAISGALEKIDLNPSLIDEVYMGNVYQAGLGQAPARQASILAGIDYTVPCTTINRVCSSGMKSIIIAAQAIKSGDAHVVVAGGMESMSNVPYYLSRSNMKSKLGNMPLEDGLIKDGLTDVYNHVHMGYCAEQCAERYSVSREKQDSFAISSYNRSAEAWKAGRFKQEIVPVKISDKKGNTIIIDEDQEYKNVILDKIPLLKPVFKKEGTVTAANSSTISDGACVLILMSEEKAATLNIKPIAEIITYADAANEPEWFTITPTKAIENALNKGNISVSEIDYFELNEAFSVVGIVNAELLKISPQKLNVNGGAVSLGHPLGCSGARIVVSLINILKQKKATLGVAGVCNGGGGASAMVIKNV